MAKVIAFSLATAGDCPRTRVQLAGALRARGKIAMKLTWLLRIACGLLAVFLMEAQAQGKTCANMPNAPNRIVLNEFSVDAPTEGGWCTEGPNAYLSVIILHKDLSYDKWKVLISKEDRAHTAYLQVQMVDIENVRVANQSELLEFVKVWIDHDFPTIPLFSGKSRLSLEHGDPPSDDRFTLLHTNVAKENIGTGQCVRYISRIEERNNNKYPNDVLILESFGYFCVDPIDARELHHIVASERCIKGTPQCPSFAVASNSELRAVFASYRSLSKAQWEAGAPKWPQVLHLAARFLLVGIIP
jgi:hypothetical protein